MHNSYLVTNEQYMRNNAKMDWMFLFIWSFTLNKRLSFLVLKKRKLYLYYIADLMVLVIFPAQGFTMRWNVDIKKKKKKIVDQFQHDLPIAISPNHNFPKGHTRSSSVGNEILSNIIYSS